MISYSYSNENGRLKEVADPAPTETLFSLFDAQRALNSALANQAAAQAALDVAAADVAIAQNRVDQAIALGVN